MAALISIIVPVYNVAPYLGRCLQSIVAQGLDDWEALLVNDASRDNSLAICNEWARREPRFRVVSHDKNKGLSEARNTGLRLATGKYIAFVDSDDSLTPNTLGEAMRAIEGAEVVEFPVVQGYLSKHAQRWEPTEQTINFEEWMRRDGFTHCYACNKVFARSLWQDIEFPAGRIFEDIRTIPRVLQKANGIRGTREGAYLYCDRENSISNTLSLDKLQQYVEALLELMSLPEAAGNTALYLQALNGQISYHRMGGKGRLVPPSKVPWAYVFKQGLTAKQRIKALWFKLTYR